MSDTETQAIERATAEGFLAHYNAREETDYRVVAVAGPGESPDVKCVSSSGDELWLEVTITEDNLRDAQALLGRSEHKSPDALRALLHKVKKGAAKMPITRVDGSVLQILIDRLRRKFEKRYGSNVALVVREAGVSWDWELVLPTVRDAFHSAPNPFDRGVWLLSLAKDRLTRVF
ncbi:MAG: hypothetical protein WCV99_16380 [Sterolibacterium sp.]|jgi:hypothetical protein